MVIADTSFWVALANPRDDDHTSAVRAMERLTEPLITTWPVITETCYLLLTRIGQHAQVGFIDRLIARDFQVFQLQTGHTPRIAELISKVRGSANGLSGCFVGHFGRAFGRWANFVG